MSDSLTTATQMLVKKTTICPNLCCVLFPTGATEESGVSTGEDPRTALSPRATERSDTDVSNTATVRYMKLVAAMAAFSLVAFGINKAVQHFK